MDPFSIIILIICTVFFAVFTWFFSIRTNRPHGIPRFFAFESILLLALLNAPVWFINPFSWNQIVSWIFLFVSIVFAFNGFLLLRIVGKPHGDFENTSKLVVIGLYRLIRHPLYASLVFLGTGIFFKQITLETVVLVFVNFGALIFTGKREEKEMLEKFGEQYSIYMKTTKMFLPYLY